MAVNTKGEEAAESANLGRHLLDAAHELGAGIDVHAGALVRHALIPSAGGGGAGHGAGAPHPLARLREAEALRVAGAPASCGGGGGRGSAEGAEDAGGVHGGEAAEGRRARGGTRRRRMLAAPKAIVLEGFYRGGVR